MKIFEKWLSFFWTLAWIIALTALCIYNIYYLTDKHYIDTTMLAVAVISGGYACFLIKPLIQKAKVLINNGNDETDETVFSQSESSPYERRFFNLYKKICNERIICVAFFTILVGIALFLIDFLCLPDHPGKEWVMKNVLYGLASLTPCIVLLCKIMTASKRNMRLLEEVYSTSSFGEIQIIDDIVKKGSTYIFTQKYFLNWDFNLNIVALNEIENIRYVPYFYLFWYGTKLVIKERNGKKHTIWFDGPDGNAWKPFFQIKDNDIHGKVENNINVHR